MAISENKKAQLKALQERNTVIEEKEQDAASDAGAESTPEPVAEPVEKGEEVSSSAAKEEQDISQVYDDYLEMRAISWGVLTFLLIMFYPIGVLLMVNKVRRELSKTKKNVRIMMTIAIGFMGFMTVFTVLTACNLITLLDRANTLGVTVFFDLVAFISGYLMIKSGKKALRLAKLDETYKPIILDTPDGSIDAIAAKTGETYEECYQNLKELIQAGFIPSAKIKKSTRCLVVRKEVF